MAKTLSAAQRKDLLKRYRGRVEHARRARSKDGHEELWRKLIDLYRGRHFNTQMLGEEDRIAVNICFATINVIAPSVAVNYPKLVVYARKGEDSPKATILETVLNYWWRHFKIQREVTLAVRDYLIIGHGWLKVGWRYVEEQAAVDKRELTEAADADGGSDVVPSDPSEPTANDPESESTENPYEVVEDRPFVERVSPFDMLVDPEATTISEAKWIAQKIVKPLEEVRQDKRYRQKARLNLKPDGQINPEWLEAGTEPNDDIRRVTVFEFYDLQMGTMCVFSQAGDELLVDPIPQPYAFGHPFVMMRNYEVPDEFYPMGDVEALEPLQMELDKTRSMMMNHRKRFNRKWLYDPEAFDQEGVSALKSDRDNQIVPVLPTNKPLNEVIVPLPQNAIEPQLYQYSQDIETNMDRVSGVSEYQQGQQPQVRRTATEASMIQDAANARSADKMAQVELLIAEVASRVVQLAQQYMTQDQEARVLGKNGFPIWVPYSREDIQGEFDFEVEAGSTQPHNDSWRKQNALQLLQAMTPWAQAGLVNAQELVRYALTYGFQVKNPDDFLAAPQPQPQGDQQKSPRQSIIESLNYKDAPADIQRQMEEAAGFQPSQQGGSSPAEQMLTQHQGALNQQATQLQQAALQHAAQQAQLQHAKQMEGAKQAHEHGMALTNAAVAQESQERQHQMGAEVATQELEQALMQQAADARYQYQAQNYAHKLGED